MSRTDRLLSGYAAFILKHRKTVVALCLAVFVAAGIGAKNLKLSNDTRVFFGPQNPQLKEYEDFEKIYTGSWSVIFIVQPKDGDLFRPRAIDAVEKLTREAWSIPHSERVDSITNFQQGVASPDGSLLVVRDMIRGALAMTEKELQDRKQKIIDEPLLYRALLSEDAQATAVAVTLRLPRELPKATPEAVEKAREIRDRLMAEYPELDVVLSGTAMLDNAFAEAGERDAAALFPIMYVILTAIIAVSLRSFAGTFITLMVIACSSGVAMGLAGYAGMLLNPVSVQCPTLILTLAVADSIHVLVSVLTLMRQGMGKEEALRESLRINIVPVTITSLTTMAGFLTLNYSDAPPFHDLGNITAVGIAVAWIYSLSFLPAAISLMPLRVKQEKEGRGGMTLRLVRYTRFVIANRWSLLCGSLLSAVGLALLIPTIELSDQWMEFFDWSTAYRRDAEFGVKAMKSAYPVEFSFTAAGPGDISAPKYLEDLEKFTAWLELQPEVVHAYSYSRIVKRLNQNMHGGDPAWYRLPGDRKLAAQYLLTYEMALPYGLDLNDRINVDESATRVTVLLGNITTRQVRGFLARARTWLDGNTPPGQVHTRGTGYTVLSAYLSERNIRDMLEGNVVEIVVIAALIMLFLRSFGFGLLSIVPNALPTIMTFGVWAIVVGKVGMASAISSSVALGVIVDDTVHFLSKYLLARREKGMSREAAIEYAFGTVGFALILTTVILVAGFLVLTFSTFVAVKQLGWLTVCTLLFGLVLDFTLLPAMLLVGHKKDAGRAG